MAFESQEFRPTLGKAEELDVAIYLHPEIGPRAVRSLYYDGSDDDPSVGVARGGWDGIEIAVDPNSGSAC